MSERSSYDQTGWNIKGDVYNIANAAPAAPARAVVIPYPRNQAFGGRDAELAWLAARLAVPDTAVAITAAGGVGKTQLAVEFARRCAADAAGWPGGVIWLSMAQPDAVNTAVAAAGAALGLPGYAGMSLDEQVAAVRAAWAAPAQRLLVFDNCENPALLRAWRPPTGSGARVLITARRTDWPAALVARHALQPLPRPAALELLLHARAAVLDCPIGTLTDDADAAAICAELGDHALALHLAGAFLAQRPTMPLARFLAELHDKQLDHAALQALDPDSPTGYPRNIAATIALSYALLSEHVPADDDARDLLALAAHCAPSVPIPLALLQHAAQAEEGPVNDAARRLVTLGLAGYAENGTALAAHRLVAAYALGLQDPAIAIKIANALIDALAELTGALDQGSLAQMQPILPHAQHAATFSNEPEVDDLATLLNNIGVYFGDAAAYTTALDYHTRALAIREQSLPPDHPDIALSLNNLGTVAVSAGDYAAARTYLTRALAIDEQSLPADHPNIAYDLNNLGGLAHTEGDYDAARAYLTRAFSILEQALPIDNPLIAASLNNLGEMARQTGDYAAAHTYHTRALGIKQQILPAGHPDIALSLNNLGLVAQDEGAYTSAREYLARALSIWEHALPAGHPDIAKSLNNLGMVAYGASDYASAREYYTRALAIWQQALPNDHPDIATCLNNLGMVAQAGGDYTAAREYFTHALAILERVLPATHYLIATCLNNLGGLVQVEGDYASGYKYLTRALAILEQSLPAGHPYIATCRTNLGIVAYGKGDYAAAREYLTDALAILEQSLPADHPNIRLVHTSLATVDAAESLTHRDTAGQKQPPR